MEPTEEEMIEWLRVLGLPEDEFRKAIRPYFNDTEAMNVYIEERAPDFDYMNSEYTGDSTQQLEKRVPTMPMFLQDLESGHYKGKRRKR
jgi:hypothetical protein